MFTVADILREKGDQVWTVGRSAVVGDAVELMADKNVGAVVVVGDDGKPVGIISERDIARALLKRSSGIRETPVADIMTKLVKSIRETLSMQEVMAVMTHNRFRHLPVSRDGQLAGLVSIGDVVKAEIQERGVVIDQLEHYIAGSL
ncbi:MAG: CBS domain-containing protein [Spirochaetales bacterium]|nr:CBS domain-containing protein [Spirochaetales bacterium]